MGTRSNLKFESPPNPRGILALSEFHERGIYPGESPQKYLYKVKRLLKRTFPKMIPESKEQLLSEQFIRGLPRYVYENIRTSPVLKTTEDAMKRAQLVILMHEEAPLRGSEEGLWLALGFRWIVCKRKLRIKK